MTGKTVHRQKSIVVYTKMHCLDYMNAMIRLISTLIADHLFNADRTPLTTFRARPLDVEAVCLT